MQEKQFKADGLVATGPKCEWQGGERTSLGVLPSGHPGSPVIHFILLFSRQGKLRLQKWYTTLPDKERKKITREIVQLILSRGQRTSSFIDWKELKLVYKRYASLYFCCAIENQDNELLTLEIVHRYVELLDKYFGNVCELDIIFNFEKAYFILDEFIIGGEVQETSKQSAVTAIEDSDMLQEVGARLTAHDNGGIHEQAYVLTLRLLEDPRGCILRTCRCSVLHCAR
ncbi:AP-1 complex subunit sigma-3 [Echinops telfairi]|uniref:AP-1 complex subunit sigma-3 n=1 Tax=Echinops telfairi TaxID=9371 RepID=A0AC55DEJ0_ECHTE|nr:AP-1 complex subunit sigma-3 [Echinops telfairi]